MRKRLMLWLLMPWLHALSNYQQQCDWQFMKECVTVAEEEDLLLPTPSQWWELTGNDNIHISSNKTNTTRDPIL